MKIIAIVAWLAEGNSFAGFSCRFACRDVIRFFGFPLGETLFYTETVNFSTVWRISTGFVRERGHSMTNITGLYDSHYYSRKGRTRILTLLIANSLQ